MSQSARDRDTDRVEAFSDGVFAIAITLLVLELHVADTDSGLWRALVGEWPSFAAYLTSFFIIGIMWVNHHSMFGVIVRVDQTSWLAGATSPWRCWTPTCSSVTPR